MASSTASTPAAYLASLPPDRRATVSAVRDVIIQNLPRGFEEQMQWGMLSYVVPLSIRADTYNGQPLALAALAAQKQYVALYLLGVYADAKTAEWFAKAWKATGKKLDMGKSCVRFGSLEDVPLPVVAQAIARHSLADFLRVHDAGRAAATKGRASSTRAKTRKTGAARKRATVAGPARRAVRATKSAR